MKIAFSGIQGANKTVSVLNKARELKLKYPTKTVATLTNNPIDYSLLINKKATVESQLQVFKEQLNKEIEMASRFDILVCDKSIFDVVTYIWWLDSKTGFITFKLAIEMVDTYNIIYFKRLKNNNYLFNDGLRDITDKKFMEYVDTRLEYIFLMIREMGAKVKIVEM